MGYEPIARSGEFTRRLVPGQARENQFLDFKRDPWNQTEKRECASDVAQFANASGGVLVIGADEQDHVLSGFKAVPRPDELLRWVDDVLKGHLEPVPPIDPHILNGPVGEAVVVMNIPPSLALVARKAGEGYEFP